MPAGAEGLCGLLLDDLAQAWCLVLQPSKASQAGVQSDLMGIGWKSIECEWFSYMCQQAPAVLEIHSTMLLLLRYFSRRAACIDLNWVHQRSRVGLEGG